MDVMIDIYHIIGQGLVLLGILVLVCTCLISCVFYVFSRDRVLLRLLDGIIFGLTIILSADIVFLLEGNRRFYYDLGLLAALMLLRVGYDYASKVLREQKPEKESA